MPRGCCRAELPDRLPGGPNALKIKKTVQLAEAYQYTVDKNEISHCDCPVQAIIRSYREACRVAVAELHRQAVSLEDRTLEQKQDLLRKCASTSMNSKLISGEKEFFSDMVVNAVSCLDTATLDLKMIGIKKARFFCYVPRSECALSIVGCCVLQRHCRQRCVLPRPCQVVPCLTSR